MREGALKYSLEMILVVIFFIYCLFPGILGAQQKIFEDLFSATFPMRRKAGCAAV